MPTNYRPDSKWEIYRQDDGKLQTCFFFQELQTKNVVSLRLSVDYENKNFILVSYFVSSFM